jgi:hypothetical protein
LNEMTSASREASLKLLSQEMLDEMAKRSQEPEVQESLKGLSIRLVMVATDCPGKEDRQCNLVIEDGKITKAEAIIKPAPSDLRDAPLDKSQIDAKVLSPFGPLTDILQEKIRLISSFEHIKIESDLTKLMLQVEGFVAFLKFIGSLPVEWDK